MAGFGIYFLEVKMCEKPVAAGRSAGVENTNTEGEAVLLVDSEDEKGISEAITNSFTD